MSFLNWKEYACVLAVGLSAAAWLHGATFNPITVADLIADINVANTNSANDIIDLGGRTFTLNTSNFANDLTDGINGLPSILADGGNTFTMQNGIVERDALSTPADDFRLMHFSVGATVQITNVTFRNGLAAAGGALGDTGGGLLNLSILRIDGSVLTSNVAVADAGGLGNHGGLVISINNTTFIGNSAHRGGGVFNDAGVILSFTNSTFSGNGAATSGGAIFNDHGTISFILNSTFSGNSAAGNDGGAIFNGTSLIVLSPPGTISNILNSTFASNFAGGSGGGIFNAQRSLTSAGGVIESLISTIVAGNFASFAPDVFGDIASESFNFIGINEGSNIVAGNPNVNNSIVGTSLFPLDPRLGPLADNGGPTQTRALLEGSKAINSGSNPLNVPYDQRGVGFLRMVGGATDIGAFEVQNHDEPDDDDDDDDDRVQDNDGGDDEYIALDVPLAF